MSAAVRLAKQAGDLGVSLMLGAENLQRQACILEDLVSAALKANDDESCAKYYDWLVIAMGEIHMERATDERVKAESVRLDEKVMEKSIQILSSLNLSLPFPVLKDKVVRNIICIIVGTTDEILAIEWFKAIANFGFPVSRDHARVVEALRERLKHGVEPERIQSLIAALTTFDLTKFHIGHEGLLEVLVIARNKQLGSKYCGREAIVMEPVTSCSEYAIRYLLKQSKAVAALEQRADRLLDIIHTKCVELNVKTPCSFQYENLTSITIFVEMMRSRTGKIEDQMTRCGERVSSVIKRWQEENPIHVNVYLIGGEAGSFAPNKTFTVFAE